MQFFYIRKMTEFPYQYFYERRDNMCIFGTDLNKAKLFPTFFKALGYTKRKLHNWLPSVEFKLDAVEVKISNV